MPNPFPGVDPYVELTDLWVGFQNTLISDFSKLLNPFLRNRGYAAIVEKRVDLADVHLDDGYERRPDVAIAGLRDPIPWTPSPNSSGTLAVAEARSTKVTLPNYESVPVAYLNIRRLPGRELVSVIELLSPSNKVGRTRRDYLTKRVALLSTSFNLVEIDLLLAGRRPPVIGDVPAGDLCAFVCRGEERPDCQAFAWSIRDRLPTLPVPLRPGEDEVPLDLAAAYTMTYDGGAFDTLVPYDEPLPGPLSDADRAWVAERVTTVRH